MRMHWQRLGSPWCDGLAGFSVREIFLFIIQ
jgi:hypothetical protein